ncbi:hypothetical protein EDB92DRAFT_684761 [Lactarius akahatsu]|uniref:DUF6535 domain-containing protein n=1 Tax=Lactarius akahatsu TaxID=416441 RepID=A0AAD4LGS3_9AGAM|nr:hypothetical protein EDB92DRAFT_684761 [Lactarius akahatsu]
MTRIATQQHPSQNAGDGTTAPKEITYSDSSGTIFSMYINRALEFDDENVENWKGGADSILLFTGLFSSTVATFIAMSYPNLQQDPNITTQSLLVKISQQLSNPNGTSPAASSSTFTPPASVVFVNSVWFLSLVLSLTCALIATLLQQWARRYLQMIQRNHAPHVRAHIREYFYRGARQFRIFGLVEALPFLILISVLLFFTGLVVFAFPTNHTVAFITLAIVAICLILYIALSLTPLKYHDCPYYTPFTSLIWYSAQIIPLSYFSALYHSTKLWYDRWGSDGESIVKSFHDRKINKAKSFSDGMTSEFESSAKRISMVIYKETLIRTLNWLSEDRDLEKFVTGIPGLCESEALATRDSGDTQRTIRDVLAALPGPTSFHASLPWSIIQLAQRAFTSKLPESIQQPRTRACLKALYYIPGAIRDVLAPYAAGEPHFSEILPLLNSPESLEVIEELWDTPNDDVALSVRCAAAVVTAFMIIPPGRMLDNFSTLNVGSIWDDEAGKKFLTKRLGDGANADGGVGPGYHPRSDSGRLQNIARFLADIKNTLRDMNTQWWASDNAESIRRERRALFETRHAEDYTGHGTFDQKRNRESPAFVPAAQQDLIVLTLEILARDPVANVATPRSDVFREAYKQFKKVALTQALIRAQTQALPQSPAEYETRARIRAQAADSSDMVKRALGPVLQSLGLEMPPLQGVTSPPHILVQAVPDTAVTAVRPDDGPVPEHAAPVQKSPPPGQVEAIPSLPYSMASSSAFGQADAVEPGDSPV